MASSLDANILGLNFLFDVFLAIFLGSQKISFDGFKKMILNCDENLKESAIEALLRYLPSADEVI